MPQNRVQQAALKDLANMKPAPLNRHSQPMFQSPKPKWVTPNVKLLSLDREGLVLSELAATRPGQALRSSKSLQRLIWAFQDFGMLGVSASNVRPRRMRDSQNLSQLQNARQQNCKRVS